MSGLPEPGAFGKTRKSIAILSASEVEWRQRQPYLLSKGYRLRARYQPDWEPSWEKVGADGDPTLREDAIRLPVSLGPPPRM